MNKLVKTSFQYRTSCVDLHFRQAADMNLEAIEVQMSPV